MKTGDQVRVFPVGKPESCAAAVVRLASANQLSLALEFPEAPIFCKHILDSGGRIGINRETYKVTMLLSRIDDTWMDVSGSGDYEIQEGLEEGDAY